MSGPTNDQAHGHHSQGHHPQGHDGHGHDHHGDHHDDHGLGGAAHGTMRDYVTGFVLAVILTVIPFWIVMNRSIESSSMTALVILLIGAVQIVVHMVYFLHMNARSEEGWTLLALIFTLVMVVITLTGSLWVMFHLNYNMMPGMNPWSN